MSSAVSRREFLTQLPGRTLRKSRRNGLVHEHVRNMSIANMVPGKWDGLPGAGEKEREPKEEVRERSPLADLLYLRCEFCHPVLVNW
jgi:hypothetical protein